ncbi:hypothetical protein [Cohaesibacter intestini]|uniref:hypothetical protein n=1 Tax=Cohaesibacter intestini TaxID=2211145 RepID=UPI000DE8DE18|nr:hypothetical protein [Cohaesibacter intestini]
MIRFSYKTIPTHDLYFRHPLRDLITEGRLEGRRPIRRIGDNCFEAKGRLVILRYLSDRDARLIASRQWQRCYYVIDDDFAALDQDRSIPEDYRQRMLRFREIMLPEILRHADTIVAPNPRLFSFYPDKRHLLLDPCAVSICKDFSHFREDEPLRILFPGTRSHLNDLAFLSECLAQICWEQPQLQLDTFMGHHAPAALRGLPNVLHHKAKGWQVYRKFMARQRYHLCLVPMLDTHFNQARSINKILDSAAFGAAALFSPVGPVADALGPLSKLAVIDNEAELWDAKIRDILSDRQALRPIAEALASLAHTIGDPAHVRRFWHHHLQLD